MIQDVFLFSKSATDVVNLIVSYLHIFGLFFFFFFLFTSFCKFAVISAYNHTVENRYLLYARRVKRHIAPVGSDTVPI